MRNLLCVCTLSLGVACGGALALAQAEQKGPVPQAATPAPGSVDTLVGMQKNPAPSPQGSPAKSSAADSPDQIRKRGADWLAQCLQDWDAATHLTRKEWQRVCRRVAGERVNELLKQAKQ
jgi:hypothetical protein